MDTQNTSMGEVKIGRTGVDRVGIGADPGSSFFDSRWNNTSAYC